jgi:hypothetical protein
VVLEEHVVFVRRATNTSEHIAFHELVNVRAETVNNLFSQHMLVKVKLRTASPACRRRDQHTS